jgi:Tfp pilus assembly protein PilV
MNERPDKLSPSRAGLTLVEALAAMLLMGTLLVASLMAHGRLVRQQRLAEQRLDACHALDTLMVGWWQELEKFPIDEHGQAGSAWQWRTRLLTHPAAAAMGARAVRVELLPAGQSQVEPAASIELLLPPVKEDANAAPPPEKGTPASHAPTARP